MCFSSQVHKPFRLQVHWTCCPLLCVHTIACPFAIVSVCGSAWIGRIFVCQSIFLICGQIPKASNTILTCAHTSPPPTSTWQPFTHKQSSSSLGLLPFVRIPGAAWPQPVPASPSSSHHSCCRNTVQRPLFYSLPWCDSVCPASWAQHQLEWRHI